MHSGLHWNFAQLSRRRARAISQSREVGLFFTAFKGVYRNTFLEVGDTISLRWFGLNQFVWPEEYSQSRTIRIEPPPLPELVPLPFLPHIANPPNAVQGLTRQAFFPQVNAEQ
jgi:hypothetical protein